MEQWVVWLIIAAVLAIAEVATLTFLLLPFSLAALAAAIASGIGAGPVVSMVVFAVGAIVAFLLVRPLARRHLRAPAKTRTGVAALTGQRAQVIEAIGAESGRIKLAGEVWSAKSFDGTAIAAGSEVTVVEIAGATAVVMQ